ncbi:MAG: CDP-diacylglycerol--glycerol-3-phosphate 3-phosphatidyltransferase [Lachnospiraceae bacterium]|nr:CDP-diacylglycerol--glycerol-3-phosphate 3-phosphatidyltransferase [Lachnospiraceae bacterium]
MNLPNKLTLLRVFMVPFFVILLLAWPDWFLMRVIADIIFIAASITDFLDGYIARSRNLITNFGKFMDPLADKLLVVSAMICLTSLGWLPAWFTIIVVAREFFISGFRLIAVENGKVIAAGWWGKFKTAFSMIMIIVMVLHIDNPVIYVIEQVLMWVSLVLTVISMIDYVVKNREVLKEQK